MATPNLVPRATGEGNIGTSSKKWLKGYFDNGISTGSDTLKPSGTSVADFVLKDGATGTPTGTAGITIERGSSTNVGLRWNETGTKWEYTNDGSTWEAIGTSSAAYLVKVNSGDTGGYLGSKIDTGTLAVVGAEAPYSIGVKANTFVTITGAETISGAKTFSSGILVSSIGKLPAGTQIEIDNVLDLNSNKIIGLGTPTGDADAATKAYVDSKVQGIDWQESVLDAFVNTPPGSPVTGDRYIVGGSPTGAWASNANDITQWSGTAWTFTVKNLGMATYVEDETKQYLWNGTAWVTFGSTTSHNATSGLQGGTTSEYYHLTNAQHGNLTGGTPSFATSVATPTLYVTTVSESASPGDTGVTIDGVKLKDSQVSTDVINELTSTYGVTVDGVLLKDSQVYTNVISEKASPGDTGVTVDGVLLKDSAVGVNTINEYPASGLGVTIEGVKFDSNVAYVDTIAEKTGSAGVSVSSVLKVNHIAEVTGSHGVEFDQIIVATNGMKIDTISEKTSAAGVTIDSVKCKDGDLTVGATSNFIYTDKIAEFPASTNGVTVGGVLLKAGDVSVGATTNYVYTDKIGELTSTYGVTVDGVLLKDGTVATNTVVSSDHAAYKMEFDAANHHWVFNGIKAGGTDVYKWSFDVDENGDLMPYVAAAA
jgi:hypothetical protein